MEQTQQTKTTEMLNFLFSMEMANIVKTKAALIEELARELGASVCTSKIDVFYGEFVMNLFHECCNGSNFLSVDIDALTASVVERIKAMDMGKLQQASTLQCVPKIAAFVDGLRKKLGLYAFRQNFDEFATAHADSAEDPRKLFRDFMSSQTIH